MPGHAFGVVGLGVMGSNFALNVERNGFPVAVYDVSAAAAERFVNDTAKGQAIAATPTLPQLAQLVSRPRRILLLVPAGGPVDSVIDSLRPHLEGGDVLIDGGNSHFADTERRMKALAPHSIHFVGMGISGGAEGALWGPSLMPGGDREAYDRLEPVLTRIAAHSESGPCVTYVGERGAGHLVKMVHNGIEYGDMQLIAEAYDLLKNVAGLDDQRIADTFADWNDGRDLRSFLIDAASQVLNAADPEGSGLPLVETILDEAGAKGTGKWTVELALDLGVPVPTITAAVEARDISAMKDERLAASKLLHGPTLDPQTAELEISNLKSFVQDLRNTLYCARVCCLAQGFALLAAAERELRYGMSIAELARIWKAGCIIRSSLLDPIMQAYGKDPALLNLLIADLFRESIAAREGSWRRITAIASAFGIPIPATSASLAYYDSYRRPRLPANLIQAQRDLFGGHTYRRLDRPGTLK